MTITTKEAEECARGQDSIKESSQFPGYRSIACRAAATIRSLVAERDALQARVAELEEALDAASRVLHKAGEQFASYANQHAAKGTADGAEKAATNKQWAERCFSAYWRAVEGGGAHIRAAAGEVKP